MTVRSDPGSPDPAASAAPAVTLVVLAGGTSRRFGSDKLTADLAGSPLLHRCLDGVPADWELVLVGDPRPLPRAARFVREEPPGSGPAAALVAGVRAARAPVVVSTPGDAPAGGRAATALVAALDGGTGAQARIDACVAVGRDGQEQPLQLALRGAARDRVAGLDPVRAVNASARRLLLPLIGAHRVELAAHLTFDVDTVAQADGYRARHSDQVD